MEVDIKKESAKPSCIMLAKIFKVLVYGTSWVDMNLLSKGIYTSDIPVLYDKDTTIQDLIDRAERIKGATGSSSLFPVSYFENLEKCELKTYYLYYY